MEKNCLKTNLCMNKTVLSETLEQPVDIDFILPDYLPDAVRIIKSCAEPKITSKSVNNNTVTLDGSVFVSVMYCSEDMSLYSFECLYPFCKTYDTQCDIEDANIMANAKCEYLNVRMITERKIDIHGAVSVCLKVKKKEKKEIISDINDDNIEILKGDFKNISFIGQNEKYLVVEEEIALENIKNAKSILRYSADSYVKECKIISGKVIVKGDIKVNMLFCAEESQTAKFKISIPFSQIVEIENISEDDCLSAKTKICYLDIKPKIGSDGFITASEINAKLLIVAEAYKKCNSGFVFDAYSKEYEADIKKENLCIKSIKKEIEETFTAKDIIKTDSEIKNVIDCILVIKDSKSEIMSGELKVSGTLCASLIYCDSDGSPACKDKTFDFSYTYLLEEKNCEYSITPDISVLSANYTISGADTVEISAEMSVKGMVLKCETKPVITEISLDKEKPLKREETGAMTIYFASSGENVWNIARKYLSSKAEIMKINEIENEILEEDKMILVPTK